MIEREKRWKLKENPPQDKIKDKFIIEQTYANFNPNVRIRKITKGEDNTYYHTVKYNLKDGTREELEHRISGERFDRISEVINKKPVIKERTLVDLENDLVAEIDHFLDNDKSIIEVEFPNEQSQKDFVVPDWFGTEINDKKSFSIEIFKEINNLDKSIWKCI